MCRPRSGRTGHWSRRGRCATLHLLDAEDLPLVVAARRLSRYRHWWYAHFRESGVTLAEYETYLDALPLLLDAEPRTREELAVRAAAHTGIEKLLPALTESSWGAGLKAAAFAGHLCFGPSPGRSVAFVHPRHYLSDWREPEPAEALREILRRYLAAYGPATPHAFARWWGEGVPFAKKAFADIADDLEPVSVDGGAPAFALRGTLPDLRSATAAGIVRLLPMFDACTFTLGGPGEPGAALPDARRKRIYRAQGWISAVVLIDGRLAGVWEYETKATRRAPVTHVTLRLFDGPPSGRPRAALEAEAERLGVFLGTRVSMAFAEG